MRKREEYKILHQKRVNNQPLFAYNLNEKRIYKDLKNLNRIEENFLILKTKSQDEQFIVESSRIICLVVEKKNKIIMKIDRKDDENQNKTYKMQQLKINDKVKKCQICFTQRRKYVAIPCGHDLHSENCKKLVEQKMKCLLYRQNVRQMFEVYA